ncbi:MAG: HlyD family efflux transporter periplasmic adaptor subunit [Lachnospiraceae bacterium]|nr:HlyD family efflux transporter periplasmic adaptor subunit [Lachnospiraceae bacterium]
MEKFKKFFAEKKAKKIIIGIILAVCIAGGIFYILYDPLEVSCVEIVPGDYKDSFTVNGVVKKGDEINYISEVEGNVLTINVSKNSSVNAGDVIAVIDDKDLQYQKEIVNSEIAALQASKVEATQDVNINRNDIIASIEEAEYTIREVESQRKLSSYTEDMTTSPEIYINTLRVARNQADTSRDYYKELVSSLEKRIKAASTVSGGDSDSDLVDLKDRLAEAKKEYDNADDEYDNAKYAYEDAVNRMNSGSLNNDYYAAIKDDFNIQLEKIKANKEALEKKLNNTNSNASALRIDNEIAAKLSELNQLDRKIAACNITAKYDGVISDLPVENINRVTAGDVIATMRGEAVLNVECNVLTSEEPYLTPGGIVNIVHKLKSEKRNYTGYITKIHDYADKTVSALGNDEYRVKVIVAVDKDEKQQLKDGYEVNVEFITFSGENLISVPNSALFKENDEYRVFTVKGGKAVITPVELLYRGNSKSAIASGLSEGDVVIADANNKELSEGRLVTAQ